MAWCILATIPSGLFAVDGVVLIDQNRALAGSITPGFPITISQPGSYRLSGNLTVTDVDTTAIQITSDAVSLDLNGFTISGPVICENSFDPAVCPAPGKGIGVQAGALGTFGPRSVKVFNGAVRGMGNFGVVMTGEGSLLERVSADGNAAGGIVVAGTVIECAGNHNGTFGILGVTVKSSTATRNYAEGILLDGSGGVGTNNIASFNGGRGMVVPNGTATGNTVVRNTGVGIQITCPSVIVENTLVNNVGGVFITDRSGCVVLNNATF